MRDARVLILQGIVPPYRVPVFEALGREVHLTVLHSGASVGEAAVHFTERVVAERRIAGFHLQSGVLRAVMEHDVAIAMFDLRWPTMLLPLLRPGGPPVVWWGHGFGASGHLRRLRAALARWADALLLYDAGSVDDFVVLGVPRERIFVAPNTVHVAAPGRREGPRRSFLYVGRIQPRKRLDLLVDAFASAAPQLPQDVTLEIVGDGGERAALEHRARDAGVGSRVHFHGAVRDETALARHFAGALAYVSPGHVGLGVLHAFAYGVPVLTRTGPGHAPEIANVTHRETGLLLPLETDAFALALVQLARDPEHSAALGRAAARHHAQGRTLDHMLAGFRDALAYVQQA